MSERRRKRAHNMFVPLSRKKGRRKDEKAGGQGLSSLVPCREFSVAPLSVQEGVPQAVTTQKRPHAVTLVDTNHYIPPNRVIGGGGVRKNPRNPWNKVHRYNSRWWLVSVLSTNQMDTAYYSPPKNYEYLLYSLYPLHPSPDLPPKTQPKPTNAQYRQSKSIS